MKALVTDYTHEILLKGLEDLGFQVTHQPDLDPANFMALAKHFELVVIKSKIKLDRKKLECLPRLRALARLGSGLEIIDVEAAKELGIKVLSAPEGNCLAVAEHALGMILSLLNNMRQAEQVVRAGEWERERFRGYELSGRTIGIIGFGHTGRAFARLLRGFDVHVLAHDLVPIDLSDFSHCREASIRDIQSHCDVVSLHLSFSEEIRGMVDKHWIGGFDNPFYLINTSRGMVINNVDLIDALQDGRVLGACLDVLDNEKPSTRSEEEKRVYSQLHHLSNVVLTPHVAGWTFESRKKIASVLLQKISASFAEDTVDKDHT